MQGPANIMARKGENLLLKIGALEAKQGIEPSIERSKYIKVGDDNDLTLLRQEKIRKHLFHLQKLLSKSFKKAKTFAIQKLVKKLKQLREDSKDEKELAGTLIPFENKLERFKEAKAENNFLIFKFQDKWNPFTKEKCSFVLIDELQGNNDDILEEICKIKTFQVELERIQREFQTFLEKLFHEGLDNEEKKLKIRKKNSSKINNKSPHLQKDPAMIYFGEKKFRTRESQPSKKRNRPGQRARKQMIEREFNYSSNDKLKSSTGKRSGKELKNLNNDTTESIHPSWKAAKEKTKVKFTGTKTVFSD